MLLWSPAWRCMVTRAHVREKGDACVLTVRARNKGDSINTREHGIGELGDEAKGRKRGGYIHVQRECQTISSGS